MANDYEYIASIASKFINSTNCPVFLTGKAGTGKTTFLKAMVETTHKNVVVAAPTGVAAINAGGVTLHSLFQLPFGSFVPVNNPPGSERISFEVNTPRSLLRELQMATHRRKLLQELELLIIDEVSMLRADLLDAIDTVLRHVRRQRHLPFGGVQMLFIGDLLQLPPVVRDEEAKFMAQFYPSLYFFDARALQNLDLLHIELEKIYRQSDPQFISVLNSIRENNLTKADADLLNQHYQPQFKPSADDGYIYLTTHNRRADEINSGTLRKLEGKTFSFNAKVEGDFPENSYPVEYTLQLKEGAQVMFIKNDPSGEQQFFNGKIGFVSEISDEEIVVSFKDGSDDAVVEPYTWENKRFTLNSETGDIEEKVIGKFIHYPIKLAWAITIHKSQGLTFKKAIIDVGGAFAPGQVYVALSRLESLDGLVLTSRIPASGLEPDKELTGFMETKDSPEALGEKLQAESVNYVAEVVFRSFDFSGISHSLKEHIDSYDKDENRSEKQQHKGWAENLASEFEQVRDIGSKFILQAKEILRTGKQDRLLLLHQRIVAAKGYFDPLMKKFSDEVNDKVYSLRSGKGIKTYLNELRELGYLFTKQMKHLARAESLVRMTLKNEELTKSELQKSLSPRDTEPAKKGPVEKKKPDRKEKPDTKRVSLELYKAGKTIPEIAGTRNLAVSTIESHLAHFVALGEIDAASFLPQEQIDRIIKVSVMLETLHLGPIHEKLDGEFSYSQIRFALAGYLSGKPEPREPNE